MKKYFFFVSILLAHLGSVDDVEAVIEESLVVEVEPEGDALPVLVEVLVHGPPLLVRVRVHKPKHILLKIFKYFLTDIKIFLFRLTWRCCC